MNDGYSICLNRWALDKDIKSELGLLLIISSLCAEKGYCYASNEYLATIFDITEQSVSNKIQKLIDKNYLEVEYKYRGSQVIYRELRLKISYTDHIKKIIPTVKENFKDNNISNNNISNNIYNTKHKYGTNGRVLLTDEQYQKLVNEFGEEFIKEKIELLDEYIQMNNNKNKYKDFNLVIRKAIRENWWTNKSYKKQNVEPEWLDKKIERSDFSEETERLCREVFGHN